MIRPDTTIEFYAMMNRGDSTYLDFYTDTNAYWMTWGGIASGLRFTAALQHSGTPSMNIVSAPVTRHFEQNNWYYAGTGEQQLIETEAVPGEGWAWGTPPEWFFPNTTRSYSFITDSIDYGVTQSRLRVRLFGTTSTPISYQARFWVNDSLAGDIVFEPRTQGLLDAPFPTSWLRNDSNRTTIASIPTVPGASQFYLDWFEVDYQRTLRAQNNQLLFKSPQSSG
ncbi:MAG: hypothetical protein HW412_2406, partial [Bacteroidetes bacterium]|nr:hypothetical protein [Bacteroidota bacterium]